MLGGLVLVRYILAVFPRVKVQVAHANVKKVIIKTLPMVNILIPFLSTISLLVCGLPIQAVFQSVTSPRSGLSEGLARPHFLAP